MEKEKKQIDMTEGSIWKQLLQFAFPLVLGGLFQQLYNTADSIIVGRFVGKEALAAVGATGSIVNILIGLFTGISIGATVVISQRFGARDEEGINDAVHTAILLSLIIGVIFSVIGVTGTPLMLRLMNTPEDTFSAAVVYLRTYFAGICGLVLFNMCAGILRAMGDSRRPLHFLIMSSFINITLDLYFIIVLGMGVGGAALATILAQFISAGALVYVLCHSNNICRLQIRALKIRKDVLYQIIDIGLPIGLQKTMIAFSNTIVISYINRFGSGAMAGWSVYQRLNQVITNITQSMSIATTTFVGQNVGAKKDDRIRKGSSMAMLLSVIMAIVYAVIVVTMARPLILLFNSEADVLEYGRKIIVFLAPFHIISCIPQIQAGELRGRGDSRGPMIIMMICYVGLRQLYLNIGWSNFQSLGFVLCGYPLAWGTCAIILPLYAKMRTYSRERNTERP